MTIVVLGLLAVIWIAVLAPPLLRKGAETRRADSVGDFRRHLGVLQRTGPSLIAPAHTRIDPQDPRWTRRPGTGRSVSMARSRALRRRRNVLVGLSVTTFFFLVIGAVPGMHVLLAAGAGFAVMLFAYMALLVRMRNMAAEREMKLTFLPGATAYDAPALLRRSAN